jgi:hypothetical protein
MNSDLMQMLNNPQNTINEHFGAGLQKEIDKLAYEITEDHHKARDSARQGDMEQANALLDGIRTKHIRYRKLRMQLGKIP